MAYLYGGIPVLSGLMASLTAFQEHHYKYNNVTGSAKIAFTHPWQGVSIAVRVVHILLVFYYGSCSLPITENGVQFRHVGIFDYDRRLSCVLRNRDR